MDWIRGYYGVPARRGGRIVFSGIDGYAYPGKITGARGGRLLVRLDGNPLGDVPVVLHPTWKVEYL